MKNIRVLEIHVVDHCNYKCKGCSHYSNLIYGIHQANEYTEALKKIQNYCEISAINILGGEPTLHPNLFEFITEIKNCISAKIRLISNGWWLENYEKMDKVLNILDELYISPHPDNKLNVQEIQNLLYNNLIHKYGIIGFVHYLENFYNFKTTEKLNNRKSCQFFGVSGCPQLLSNGILAGCPIMAYAPKEICSKSFNNLRNNAYFDIMNQNETEFIEWINRLPECCNYCEYDELICHIGENNVKI